MVASKGDFELKMTNQEKPMDMNLSACEKAKQICCNVDVWGILINIILQVRSSQVSQVISGKSVKSSQMMSGQ